MQHKLAGGAFKDAFERVRGKLAFSFLGGKAGFVNMGALLFITAYQALDGHDLHEFQDGGVAEIPFFGKRGVDIADGGRAAVPKNVENIEFGGRRF